MNMKTMLCALALMATTMASGTAAEKDSRCYELRIYYAAPDKLDALQARFRDHTLKLFEKHGMSNIGYWVPQENPDRKLIYLLAHPSRDAAKASWKTFMADPEWKAVQQRTEANGRLVTKAESIYLKPTDYSPKFAPSASSASRIFELRTYQATPGKLDDLNARFRNHTLALFHKHGMINLGYWTPMDTKQGADNTLIYIVAHHSSEAAQASWKAFRADPDWLAARKASEEKAGGSLTVKVESVYMQPTDYSPTK